ncbi:hypothetical protein ZWY2020_045635 [Hordeum vulgare]|nr:hypothetical protein ZWY2020_045635 [Hordeum vulgare]
MVVSTTPCGVDLHAPPYVLLTTWVMALIENDVFKQDWRAQGRGHILRYFTLKWSLCFLAGALTAVAAAFVANLSVERRPAPKHDADAGAKEEEEEVDEEIAADSDGAAVPVRHVSGGYAPSPFFPDSDFGGRDDDGPVLPPPAPVAVETDSPWNNKSKSQT